MRYSALPVLALIGTAVAQRPANISICDYYTTALLKDNNATNQATLLTLVVNTVVIGNYTKPNVGIKVPGILAEGEVNGTKVNLLPYFSGGLKSTNEGGKSGVSVSFLDGGGADPLKLNKPANDTTSNQYFLLTHLYQYFGTLLQCSEQGKTGFSSYGGEASMYDVHKFMNLDQYEVTYFIQQVGMAAASFGVADADVKAVGTALNSLFNYRCSPPTTAIPAQGPQLQSICVADTCPLSANATCKLEDNNGTSPEPSPVSSSASGSGTATGAASATSSAPAVSTSSNNAATLAAGSFAGVAGMIFALAL